MPGLAGLGLWKCNEKGDAVKDVVLSIVGAVLCTALFVAVMGLVSIADGNVNTDAARFVGWLKEVL